MKTKTKVISSLILVVLLGLAGVIYFKFYFVLGEGVKAGELNQIVYKGCVWKTYEGRLIMTGFRGSKQGTGIQSNEFNFSVVDKAVADTLMRCSGKFVELHYKEYNGMLPWRGMQRYVVDGVLSISPGGTPGNELPIIVGGETIDIKKKRPEVLRTFFLVLVCDFDSYSVEHHSRNSLQGVRQTDEGVVARHADTDAGGRGDIQASLVFAERVAHVKTPVGYDHAGFLGDDVAADVSVYRQGKIAGDEPGSNTGTNPEELVNTIACKQIDLQGDLVHDEEVGGGELEGKPKALVQTCEVDVRSPDRFLRQVVIGVILRKRGNHQEPEGKNCNQFSHNSPSALSLARSWGTRTLTVTPTVTSL